MSITTEFKELNAVNIFDRELKKDSITLRMSDNMSVGFSKVLEKRATLYVESVDVNDDAVSCVLGVNVNVVFVDLKGTIRQAAYNGSVAKTYRIDGISEKDDIILRAFVNNLEIDKIVGEDLTLTLFYTLSGIVFERARFSALTSLDGAYSKKKRIKNISTVKITKLPLSILETIENAEDVNYVLSSSSSIKSISAKAKLDEVEIICEVEASVTYLKNGDDNEFVTLSKSFEYVESFEVANAKEEDSVMVFPSEKNTLVSFSEEDKTFDVKCEFIISAAVTKEEESEIITEVFSKENELLTSFEVVGLNNFDGVLSSSNSDSANYAIEDLSGVVATLNKSAEFININREENALSVDVLANLSTVVNIDGSYISRDFDVPINIIVPTDEKERDYIAELFVTGGEVVKNGDGVIASVTVMANLNAISKETVSVITALEVGEEKTKDCKAIVIYVAKGGESEIDLARKVNLTPDEIAEQENLTYPLSEGQKIVLYRKRS